jgi:hypothetical protein
MSHPIGFFDDYNRFYLNYQFDYFLASCQANCIPARYPGGYEGLYNIRGENENGKED